MKNFTLVLNYGGGYESNVFFQCKDNISSDEFLQRMTLAAKDLAKSPSIVEWIARKRNHVVRYGFLFSGNQTEYELQYREILKKYGIVKKPSYDNGKCEYIDVDANHVLISAEDVQLEHVAVRVKHISYSEYDVYVPKVLNTEEQLEYIQNAVNKMCQEEVYVAGSLKRGLSETTSMIDSVSYDSDKELDVEEHEV